MRHNQSNGGFFMGALVGGVITAITSMFLGTKQGKKVKHEAVVKCRGAFKKCNAVVNKYDIEGMAKKMLRPKSKKKMARRKHR